MDELDDLGSYNGDAIHDMYVDNDCQINTDKDMDDYIETLKDWD